MKKLCLCICIACLLFGRENPFKPSSDLNSNIISTNIKEKYDEFDKEHINFPSDINVLLNVTFKYRAGDGSLKEKVMHINKSVNWQNEYILQKQTPLPKQEIAKKLDVSVTIPKQTIDITKQEEKDIDEGNLESKDIKKTKALKDISEDNETSKETKTIQKSVILEHKNKTIADKNETILSKTQKKSDLDQGLENSSTNIARPAHKISNSVDKTKNKNSFISFVASKNSLNIITDSKMLKHFAHEKNKIVIDFSSKRQAFKTKTIKLGEGVFENVTLGSHKNMYRATIKLNSKHKYSIKTTSSGYVLKILD
ncbi:MAG: AMIN domain-containing protein [Campylobacter sp.]|nr:AMIN domain-containing protein [Campylobacter sp.]